MQRGTTFVLEVNPKLPRRLARLEELAGNLWYSWDRPTRELFARLHPQLWDAVGHSPKAFLRRVDEQRLVDAADDPAFLVHVQPRALGLRRVPRRAAAPERLRMAAARATSSRTSAPSSASTRACRSTRAASASSPATTARRRATCACRSSASACCIARATSRRAIDAEGNQHAVYHDSDFETCRSTVVTGEDGSRTARRGRAARTHGAAARCGRRASATSRCTCSTPTCPRTASADRDITHRLYGGDRTTRIEQEIVLGVGGVRALRRAGPQAHGVAHERGPCGVPRARAHARAGAAGPRLRRGARGGGGEHRVHHAHAGAGRPRPLRRRHDRALLRGLLPRRRHRHRPRCSRSAARPAAATST